MIIVKQKRQGWNNLIFFLFVIIIGCHQYSNEVGPPNTSFFKFYTDENTRLIFIPQSEFEGVIVINNSDTLYYKAGYFINTLTEQLPEIIYSPFENKGINQSVTQTTEYPSEVLVPIRNFDADKFRKQNISFIRKDSSSWKYTYPIDSNMGGMIGLFIDSLFVTDHGVFKFNCYCDNPKKGQHRIINSIIHSISIVKDSINRNEAYKTLLVY